jgi:hypothetical protein
MHEIYGVQRIVPVRSIGRKKRQKELWQGVTLDGRALDMGVVRRALFPVAWRLSRNGPRLRLAIRAGMGA